MLRHLAQLARGDTADAICADDLAACERIGFAQIFSPAPPPLLERALPLMEAACALGSANACLQRAFAREESLGEESVRRRHRRALWGAWPLPPADTPEATVGWLERAERLADGPVPAASLNLGVAALEGVGRAPDPVEAARRFTEQCDAGYRVGCHWLARAHEAGAGVERDEARAAALYEEVCDRASRDTPAACRRLALLALEGAPGAPDPAEAPALLKKACVHGDAPGCVELARRYEEGDGVEASDEVARTLRRAACGHGHAAACEGAE